MNGFRPTGPKPTGPEPEHGWVRTSMLPPDGLCSQAQIDLYDLIWMQIDSAGDAKPDTALRIAAKRICADCPMLMPCLARSLIVPVTHGILGGMTYKERQTTMRIAMAHDVIPSRHTKDLERAFHALLAWLDEHPDIHRIVSNRRRNERAKAKRDGQPLGKPRNLNRLRPANGERGRPAAEAGANK